MGRIFVKASSRAKAHTRATRSLPRNRAGKSNPRGANYPMQLDRHYRNLRDNPRSSRAARRKATKFLKTFRHGK